MIKYALLLTNMFGFLFFGSFFDDGVIIEDNTPATMAAGEEVSVEITVNKGDVEGFAKLQLDLPEGMTATAGQTSGASFTFSGQKIKFIWMQLPAEQEFTVSYRLKAAPTASGNKVINGVFSYIKENQRVDYELQSKVVSVGTAVVQTVAPPTTVQYSGSDLACLRTVTEVSDNNYLVTLNVVNANLQGFAKIKERIPSGFTVNEDDSDGAVVTIESDGIKYIWFEAPDLKSFKVSYRMVGSGNPNVVGTFSYVDNNTPKEIPVIDAESPAVDPLAANTQQQSTVPVVKEPTTTKVETPAKTDTKATPVDQKVTETPKSTNTNTTVENTKTSTQPKETPKTTTGGTGVTADKKNSVVPAPETGVIYKVQIMAAHRLVNASYFKANHNFSESFTVENHEEWIKYATGSWKQYVEARTDRERIKKLYNFNGPFVTAYNDGERITVQEALMLTKQEWVQ